MGRQGEARQAEKDRSKERQTDNPVLALSNQVVQLVCVYVRTNVSVLLDGTTQCVRSGLSSVYPEISPEIDSV